MFTSTTMLPPPKISSIAPVVFAPQYAKYEKFKILRLGREVFSPLFSRQYSVESRNAFGALSARATVDPRSFFEETCKTALLVGAFASATYLVHRALVKLEVPILVGIAKDNLSAMTWMEKSPLTKYLHMQHGLVLSSALAAQIHHTLNPIYFNTGAQIKIDEAFETPSITLETEESIESTLRTNQKTSALNLFAARFKSAQLKKQDALKSLLGESPREEIATTGGEITLAKNKWGWLAKKTLHPSSGLQQIQLKDINNQLYASAKIEAKPGELSVYDLEVNEGHHAIAKDLQSGAELVKDVAKQIVYSGLRHGFKNGLKQAKNSGNPVIRLIGKSAKFMAKEIENDVRQHGNQRATLKILESTTDQVAIELSTQVISSLAGNLFRKVGR